MSILFVLLMFLLIMSISYFCQPHAAQSEFKPQAVIAPQTPRLKREFGFEIPEGYGFHPGHLWAHKESHDDARVGADKFLTNLMGKIDRVEICGVNRWVRQGQKLITLHSDGTSVDLLSPVEGVVMGINNDAFQNPALIMQDPYNRGWIAMVKSPDLTINQKNLVQGSMVAPWMQNNVSRLNGMLSKLSPAMAQDGGQPISGLLPRLAADVRQKVVTEFFLS